MKRTFLAVLMAATMILAASCDKDNGNNNPPEETADPKVTVSIDTVTAYSFTYTVSPSDAETVAWMVLSADEPVPTAEDIIANGERMNATVPSITRTAENLTPETGYIVVAAASSEDVYSEVATQSVTTSEELLVPTVTIGEFTRLTRTAATFTYSHTDAARVSYVAIVQGNEIPAPEQILAEGVSIDPAASEATVDNLTAGQRYVLALAAVSDKDMYSEVSDTTFVTMNAYLADEDVSDVVFSDVQARINGNYITAVFTDESGTTSLQVAFYANLVDKKVPDGTYEVAPDNLQTEGIKPGIAYGENDYEYTVLSLEGGAELGQIDSGTMAVGDGVYTFNFTFNEYFNFSGTFNGEIAFESALGSTLNGDYPEANFSSGEAVSFKAYNWTDGSDDSYVRFLIDDEGGDKFYGEIFTHTAAIPLGTFQANSGEGFEEGTFKIGECSTVSKIRNSGTALEIKPDRSDKNTWSAAPAADGTITITDNGNGTYTLSFDLYDDIGYNFKGTYTGELTMLYF